MPHQECTVVAFTPRWLLAIPVVAVMDTFSPWHTKLLMMHLFWKSKDINVTLYRLIYVVTNFKQVDKVQNIGQTDLITTEPFCTTQNLSTGLAETCHYMSLGIVSEIWI